MRCPALSPPFSHSFIHYPPGFLSGDDGAVMRKEAVHSVLLNATLFKGMRCTLAQDPRYLRFSVLEAGTTSHYNLRVRLWFTRFSPLHTLISTISSTCFFMSRCRVPKLQKSCWKRLICISPSTERGKGTISVTMSFPFVFVWFFLVVVVRWEMKWTGAALMHSSVSFRHYTQ